MLGPRWRNVLLAATSLVFYAYGAHALVLLFACSIAFNYVAGRLIGRFRGAGDDRPRGSRCGSRSS